MKEIIVGLVKEVKGIEGIEEKNSLIEKFIEECKDKEECLRVCLGMLGMLRSVKENGRKEELKCILKNGEFSIGEIGEKMNINNKNVSSLLSYIRKEGWLLGKNSSGKIVVEKEGE